MSPSIHVLDPLTDARWAGLVARHPRASVFHTTRWLHALKQTYGYEPFALTTTGAGALEDGLVCCRVRSWAASRIVSLPFSDHCDPLVDREDALALMLGALADEVARGPWRSFEVRPRCGIPESAGGQPFRAADDPETVRAGGRPFRVAESQRYMLHTLDLRRPADTVFQGFHPSSTQRAIRKAEREGVTYAAGRSDAHVAEFHRLLRLTRRRHGLPPQPFAWFRHLADSMGDMLTVHLARRDGLAIAAIMTLSFRTTVVYKYGGSDAAFHSQGAMPFLFWQAIRAALADGAAMMDLGRSDLDQPGLIAFKDHLGAARKELRYYAWPERLGTASTARALTRVARKIVPFLPDTVLDWTGRLLYRHLG